MGNDVNAVIAVSNIGKYWYDNAVVPDKSDQESSAKQSSIQLENGNTNYYDFQNTPESRQHRITNAVNTLNHLSDETSLSVHFEYNQDADRVVMKFIDPNNNQIVKQIPSEIVIDTDIQIRKFIGVLFDKMV